MNNKQGWFLFIFTLSFKKVALLSKKENIS